MIERRPLAPGLILLWLSAPDVSRGARPGQFVMVHPTGTLDPFLARALWIHRLRDGEDGEELALLIEVMGRGTALIAEAAPGQRLTVTGPLGRPLPLAPAVRSLLL
ncbi:MAG: NAD-dependent dihydroorotate dehydrogenase B electron transfer subunit, partial [Dehalococcoidia bacterium]